FVLTFFFWCHVALRDLHSFPTRRSSDLLIPSDWIQGTCAVNCIAEVVESKWNHRCSDRTKVTSVVANVIILIACSDSLRTNISRDRKSTRLNSSHVKISYAVFCLKKKKQ